MSRDNNNPGNLKVTTSNIDLQGLVNPIVGEFAKFENTALGFRGLTRDILTKEKRGLTSIRAIITEFAPPIENDTQNYINNVAGSLNLDPDAVLNLISNGPRTLAMVTAIAHRADSSISYAKELIAKGVALEGTHDFGDLGVVGETLIASLPNNVKISGLGTPVTGVSSSKTEETTESNINTKKILNKKLSTASREIYEEIRPNLLNKYATYTYNLTWAILKKDMYNVLTSFKLNLDEVNQYKSFYSRLENEGVIMMRSGGANVKSKNQFFQDDFYMDNFTMESIVGMSMDTRSTNATNLSWTVTEPYGVTLMERIYSLAETIQEGNKNYLNQPYLMIIEFFGYGDNGKPLRLPPTRKIVPFTLTGIEFSVNAAGATYTVSAVPFNELGNSRLHGVFDSDQTLMASTVEEALETGNNFTTTKRTFKSTQTDDLGRVRQIPATTTTKNSTIDANSKRGIAGILNDEQRFKVNEGFQEFADKYSIKVDDHDDGKFKKSRLTVDLDHDQRTADANSTPGSTTAKKIQSQVQQGVRVPSDKKLNINAGTNIFDAINTIISKSDYVTKQLKEGPDGNKKITNPVKWYKILPHIKLLNFDRCRNDYAKEISYYVKPFKIASSNYTRAEVKDEIVITKEYYYLFTGKNTQVLGFDIQFNVSYFETKTVKDRNQGNQGKVTALKNTASDNLTREEKLRFNCQHKKTTMPVSVYSSIDDGAPGTNASRSVNELQSRSMFEALMKTAKGDLVTLELKVLGDPDYIFQHSYFSPVAPDNDSSYDDLTGSIKTDDTEIILRLNLRTPTDLNEKTGLVNFNKTFKSTNNYAGENQSTTSSMFSGMYKVIKVTHTFSSGKFEQTIECFRIYDQDNDIKINRSATNQTKDTDRPLSEKDKAKGKSDKKGSTSNSSNATITYVSPRQANRTQKTKEIPQIRTAPRPPVIEGSPGEIELDI